MITALILFVLGMLLSAFFSGSETGFYRVSRWKLVFDSRQGNSISRGLLWLTNNPTFFVATTLIGNNVANYLVSLSIVMAVQQWFVSHGHAAELLMAVALSPVVYVYGESLPKYLCYHAPNRLLRFGGPFFLVSAILFVPVSIVLWLFARLLQQIAGESPARIRTILARRELHRVLEEGHASGLLRPMQSSLAQGILTAANVPISRQMIPVARVPVINRQMPPSEVLALAERHRTTLFPLQEANDGRFVEYLRATDVQLTSEIEAVPARPLLTLAAETPHLAAIIQMQSGHHDMAQVVDRQGRAVGFVTARQLAQSLLEEGH